LNTLSPVNAELVRLVAKGLRNPEIERATGMKRRTIRAHLSDLFRQFDVTNRTELIGALIELGGANYLTDTL
jgi:DNA-binding CsgD family transcriptional regulator